MRKVYKSANVTLGQKKSIEFIQQVTPHIIDEENEAMTTYGADIDEQFEIQSRISEAEQECERLIEQAREEANLILAEAYESSKGILEKAKEDGYAEGFEIGRNDGLQTYTALIDEVKQLKQDVYSYKREVGLQLEKDIVYLIIDSIKKVLKHEMSENNELILNLIRIAIDKCTFTESLIIRVSEEDYETVHSSINQIYMMTEGIDGIEVKCDMSLKSGGVIIETVSGKIDASIETQINQIQKAFYELLGSE